MKAKTKAELIKENEHLKHLMKGIMYRCGMTCPEEKDKPKGYYEGYYKGRLAMIYLVAENAIKD